ncbi:MAG: ATPase [Dysgonamonadaceae bacterium]|nr:ATPase [Dysgonamonadaceae bacterium]
MTKYTFLVYHKQYLDFLEKIKNIGVLHIVEKPEGISENDDLRHKMQTASRIKTILGKLKYHRPKGAELAPADTNRTGLELLADIESLFIEKERLHQKLVQTEKEYDRMEVWGNFNYEEIKKLREAGYILTFFTTSLRKYEKEWEELYNAFEIDIRDGNIYFVTVTRPKEKIDIDAERITLSKKTASELDIDIVHIVKQIDMLTDEIEHRAAADYNTMQETESQVLTAVAFDKAVLNTHSEADDKVKLLEGWCPKGSEEALNNYLQSSDIYFDANEPQESENVPIKLKNNSFSRLFEPITRMYSLPNYRELDPTPLFAPFFMLFFGLCFGDAGYGLLVLIAATILKGRLAPDMRPICTLGQWLGGTTIFVGLLLTGTFFGIELVKIPALAPVKEYFLSQDALMQLALILGMFHIVFGKAVAAYKTYKQKGFKYSISHWGWVFALASLLIIYAPVALSMLGEPLDVSLSQTVKHILHGIAAVSGVAILFYNSPGKNIFLNVGSSFGSIYNSAMGLLGDTLSYVRLFAIGLAGGILGGVFNMLAIDMTASLNIVARIPLMLIILLFGHGINIGLSLIASLVHPIRLVFVEYFKNSEYGGGGVAYTPFKKA